jgi:transposase
MLTERDDTAPTEMELLLFEQLVPPDHYLRRVKPCSDVERFRALVTACYSPAMGRTAEDPGRMIKLELLPFHYHLSDREVIAAAHVNVALRSFLDLALESRVPVPRLLAQFRTRVGVERHQALVDQLITQAREQGLVRDRLRLQDATHVLANMAVPSTWPLVA